MKNLEQQISELNENLAKQLPIEILETFGKSVQDLKAKNMENNCFVLDTNGGITYKFVDTN